MVGSSSAAEAQFVSVSNLNYLELMRIQSLWVSA